MTCAIVFYMYLGSMINNVKMAKWLSEITKDPYEAKHLPRFNFTFTKDETAIRFYITSNEEVEVKEDEDENEVKSDTLKTKKKKKGKPKMEKKVYHLEYKLGDNKLTVLDNDKREKEPWRRWANVAPDSSVVLYSKNHNLYWMDKENFLKATKDYKGKTSYK